MAIDPRAKKLAEILVDYSLEIGKDDILLIRSEDLLKPFADYIGKVAIGNGADTVIYSFINLKERNKLIERNDRQELETLSGKMCQLAETATAAVSVSMFTDPLYLSGIDPKKISDFTTVVSSPYSDRIVGNGKEFKGKKWVVTAYPTRGQAKISGMNFNEYKDFVYNATNIDWPETKENFIRIKEVFDNASEVRVTAPKTDITLSLEGRGAEICTGKRNMPDGEVYYGPVEDSMEGRIYFPYEYVMEGNSAKGISLEFDGGEVVSFSAEENEAFLKYMLEMDGAKKVGEFGIGANYGIGRYTKRVLFDEKIGGTIHLALGRSYARPLDNGGGKNVSPIHWDLVCDLRKVNGFSGGKIYVDDRLVQENGKWKF